MEEWPFCIVHDYWLLKHAVCQQNQIFEHASGKPVEKDVAELNGCPRFADRM